MMHCFAKIFLLHDTTFLKKYKREKSRNPTPSSNQPSVGLVHQMAPTPKRLQIHCGSFRTYLIFYLLNLTQPTKTKPIQPLSLYNNPSERSSQVKYLEVTNVTI